MSDRSTIEDLNSKLKLISEKIRSTDAKLQSLINKIREPLLDIVPNTDILWANQDYVGSQLIYSYQPISPLGLRIAAVDGGMIVKRLVGYELLFLRAAAVIFNYTKTGVQANRIHNPIDDLQIILLDNASNQQISSQSSVLRLTSEREMAIQVLKKENPDFLLLDGPLGIPPKEIHTRVSPQTWDHLLSVQEELIELADRTGTVLCGIVKDSRAQNFTHSLADLSAPLSKRESFRILSGGSYRHTINRTTDMAFLRVLLRQGEAIAPRSQGTLFSKYPLWSSYLKIARYDTPIGIQFIASEEVEQIQARICSTLLSISGNTDLYGIPPPILEADALAKLNDTEVESILSEITSQAFDDTQFPRLRRDRLPF